jgi:hypothetical protein
MKVARQLIAVRLCLLPFRAGVAAGGFPVLDSGGGFGPAGLDLCDRRRPGGAVQDEGFLEGEAVFEMDGGKGSFIRTQIDFEEGPE